MAGECATSFTPQHSLLQVAMRVKPSTILK
jgi:hypothetical protein